MTRPLGSWGNKGFVEVYIGIGDQGRIGNFIAQKLSDTCAGSSVFGKSI